MGNMMKNFPDISFIDNCKMDEVLTQMISDYQEKYKEITQKEISLAQADPYRLIMYACAIQLYQGMQYADFAGKMGLLKYSRDGYLDNLAGLRGVTRTPATAASTQLQFSIEKPIASVVAIPLGTKVTNGNDVFFATDDYAEILVGETSVMVSATCTELGTKGNGFAPGEIKILVNTLPYISNVTNTAITYGGAETESDENLRNAIFNAPGSYATTGSEKAYIYHTKNANPTISDVVVDSPSAGMVSVYILCSGGVLPEEALLLEVEEYLMNRSVRPLTDNVVVQAPNTQSYDIAFTYYIASSNKSAVAAIQTNVETAVSAYNAWQTEKIGRDINPSYLIRKLMEAGINRVEVTSPSHMVLDRGTIATLGTVNIVYGGIEDD